MAEYVEVAVLKRHWKHVLAYPLTAGLAWLASGGGPPALSALVRQGCERGQALQALFADPERSAALGRLLSDPQTAEAVRRVLGP